MFCQFGKIPMITLISKKGYFKQELTPDGCFQYFNKRQEMDMK